MIYDYKEGKKRVLEILNNKLEVKETNKIPNETNFTYENSYYGWVSAIFVDIRNSTALFTKYDKSGLEDLEKGMVSTTGVIIVILITALVTLYFVRPKLKYKYVDANTYPVEAAEWIKENLDLDNIRLYNEYNYGSYLLYQGIPVFIDSRADLYAPEFNGTRNEDGTYSGRDIFSDYINTSSIGVYYENTFDKYDITHIIVYKNSKVNMLVSRDENYKNLYSDDRFVIYERLTN